MGPTSISVTREPDLSAALKPAEPAVQAAALVEVLRMEFLFDPMRRRIFEQVQRELTLHVAEYRQHLVAKGVTLKHINGTCHELRYMLKLCGRVPDGGIRRAAFWGDLTPSKIQTAILMLQARRRDETDRGLSTVNHYLNSLKAFCNWMVSDYRAHRSPCFTVKSLNCELDVRRARQAFMLDQVLRLIAAANNGPDIAGIPGAERATMYLLMVTSGLRAAETESLGDDSFRFGNFADVVVEAAYSKHRRRDVLPLHDEVRDIVASYLSTVGRKTKIFRRPAGNSTRALRADLAAAGLQYVDANGRYADHHSLRHTFVTELFRSGCTPTEAQAAARHADLRTTSRYCHVAEDELRDAVRRTWGTGAFARFAPDISQTTQPTSTVEVPQRGTLG